MSLNVKSILSLIVPEYSITIVTFVAIFFVLTKQMSLFLSIVFPFIVYLLVLFGFNVLNQVFDVKIDVITKPFRPIPSKKVTIQEATIFSVFLFGVSLILAFFTNLLLPWVLFAVSTLLYSHPKIFLRKYLIATPIFGLFFYVVCPFLFVSTYFNLKINYLFLAFFALIIACVSFLKDIEDLKAEKKFGIKSIPSILGEYSSIQASFFSLLGIVLIFGIVLSISNVFFIWATIISLLIVFLAGTFVLFRQYFGKVLSSSRVLNIFMLIAVIIQLVFGLIFLFI
ncbi:MAG: UbiA family prenyltransferase [Sphaerochaetaceae bacterium]|nr:UbiA family prenyltransferase [Sphaerochaetaceae bacterium]